MAPQGRKGGWQPTYKRVVAAHPSPPAGDGAAAVVDMMTEGVEAAMNHFNGAARGEKEKLEKQKAERKEEVKTQ